MPFAEVARTPFQFIFKRHGCRGRSSMTEREKYLPTQTKVTDCVTFLVALKIDCRPSTYPKRSLTCCTIFATQHFRRLRVEVLSHLWIHVSCKQSRFARDKTLWTRKTSFPTPRGRDRIPAGPSSAVCGMMYCCPNHNWDWFYLCQCCSQTTQTSNSTNLPADRTSC
jgi:hypothetical protein